MRILIIHNKYKFQGGEDHVVKNEINLLKTAGNEVATLIVDNKEITGLVGKIRAAVESGYSLSSRKRVDLCIRNSRPDIVHVHNFFPIISPSVYDACIDNNIPVIQTLHNYRLICPNGLLLRDGKVCELCIKGSAYNGTRYACYRDSHIGSFFVSRMVQGHRNRGTWNRKVDRYIALTEFARSKFIEGGLPVSKIQVKPNFYLPAVNYKPPLTFSVDTTSSYALYVGRLSEEKGIRTLIDAWRNINYPLRIAGTGPLLEYVQQQNNPYIKLLGHISAEDLHQQMSAANFIVLPSECYEGFPMVIVEAFAHGIPVIASKLGSMAEIIEASKTGLHFEKGNARDLVDKINMMLNQPELRETIARNSYTEFREKYTAERNYQILMDIYTDAITSYPL